MQEAKDLDSWLICLVYHDLATRRLVWGAVGLIGT